MFSIKDFILLASIAGVISAIFLLALALKKAYKYAFSPVAIAPTLAPSPALSSISRIAYVSSSKSFKKTSFKPQITESDPFLFKTKNDLGDTNSDLMLYQMGAENTSFMSFDD